MQMDSRLPLLGKSPSPLQSYVQGISAADAVNQINRQNALNNFMKTRGQELYAGDQTALREFANYDLEGAMRLQGTFEARRRAAAAAQARSSAAARQQEMAGLQRAFAVMSEARNQGEEAFASAAEQYGYADEMEQYGINYDNFPEASRLVNAQMGWEQPAAPEPVRGMEINGALVNPYTGETIRPAAASDNNMSAAEAKIARTTEQLLRDGFSQEDADRIAQGIVDGRLVTSRNPLTQQAQVIDKATGDIIGSVGDDVALSETYTPDAETIPNIDYTAAFGAPAVAGNAANAVTDFMGMGQVSPTTADATRILENLQNQTILVLSRSMSGRDTNQVRDLIKSMTVTPSSFSGGVADAQNRTMAMQRMLQEQLSNQEAIINGESSPSQVQAAKANARSLEGLINNYQILGESLGGQNIGAPISQDVTSASTGVSGDVAPQSFMDDADIISTAERNGLTPADLWEVLTEEQRLLWAN